MAAQGRGGRHPIAELPLAVKPSGLQETVPGVRPFRAARASHDDTESESDDESVDSSSSSDEAAKQEEAAVKRGAGSVLAQYLVSLLPRGGAPGRWQLWTRMCTAPRSARAKLAVADRASPKRGRANRVPCSHIACSRSWQLCANARLSLGRRAEARVQFNLRYGLGLSLW